MCPASGGVGVLMPLKCEGHCVVRDLQPWLYFRIRHRAPKHDANASPAHARFRLNRPASLEEGRPSDVPRASPGQGLGGGDRLVRMKGHAGCVK